MKQKASWMHFIEVRIKPMFTVAAKTTVLHDSKYKLTNSIKFCFL